MRLFTGDLPVVRGVPTAAALKADDGDDFETAMDWLYEDDDDDGPSPDRLFTDIRMTGFLEKLNSMRRKYRESSRRGKQNYPKSYRMRPPTHPVVSPKTGGQGTRVLESNF